MQMDFNRMRRMEQRVQLCAQPGPVCPPLSWTMSNRLADFAPFILQWYYRCAATACVVHADMSHVLARVTWQGALKSCPTSSIPVQDRDTSYAPAAQCVVELSQQIEC